MEVKASIPGPACALENYLIPTQERVWPACARPLRPGKDQGPLRMACFGNGLLLQRSRMDGLLLASAKKQEGWKRPRPSQIRCTVFLMDTLISFPYIMGGNNLHNYGRSGSGLPAPGPYALPNTQALSNQVYCSFSCIP